MPNTSRARILIVDDDEIDAMRLERVLEGLGCEVSVESDPMRLTAAVRYFRPSLVVMDVNMPELSGDHAARVLPMLASAMKVPEIPVVLYSGESPEVLESLATLIGAAGFISKDASPESMGEQILLIISLQHRSATS